jgi:hypothetical protein
LKRFNVLVKGNDPWLLIQADAMESEVSAGILVVRLLTGGRVVAVYSDVIFCTEDCPPEVDK